MTALLDELNQTELVTPQRPGTERRSVSELGRRTGRGASARYSVVPRSRWNTTSATGWLQVAYLATTLRQPSRERARQRPAALAA